MLDTRGRQQRVIWEAKVLLRLLVWSEILVAQRHANKVEEEEVFCVQRWKKPTTQFIVGEASSSIFLRYSSHSVYLRP